MNICCSCFKSSPITSHKLVNKNKKSSNVNKINQLHNLSYIDDLNLTSGEEKLKFETLNTGKAPYFNNND
jgi:hypothetical protein